VKVTIGVLLGSFSALLCATHPVRTWAEPPGRDNHLVVAHVSAFRNARGMLGCRLFRSADGFPESGENVVEVRVPITGATTRCEFHNVPAGIYAIAVIHDENDNRKLDKNFLGVPTEGYGVSNNKTYAMTSPKWSDSTFQIGDQDVALNINLRY